MEPRKKTLKSTRKRRRLPVVLNDREQARLLAYCAAAYDAKREYFPINLRWYVNEVQAAVQNLLRRMDELTGPPLDARRICRTFLKEAERRLQAHKRPLNG